MERKDMENVLNNLFSKGMEVNLEDETFDIIKIDSSERISCKNFSDWITIFAEEGNIHPLDKEKFLNSFNIDVLRDKICQFPYKVKYRRHVKDGIYIPVMAFMIESSKSLPNKKIMLLGIIPLNT